MALLERVGLLLRANLNDLMDRAEDPVKTLNQVVLDMENQLLQLKTQVAIAVADCHLLQSRAKENMDREAEWMRRAEAALKRGDEPMARAALEKSIPCRNMARSFTEQVADQNVQVENLKTAFGKLEAKLAETRGQAEILKARHRRARTAARAADAQSPPTGLGSERAFSRVRDLAEREAALGAAHNELARGDGVEEKFAELERNEQVERLLAELKK